MMTGARRTIDFVGFRLSLLLSYLKLDFTIKQIIEIQHII